ncbi:MAG: MFS transporter [Candidatus Eisenbacteria bacterium]|nr:MFS transporter [Candidatus Eisenbacteria bacterium]
MGYLELLRRNRPFRLLWAGQVVSQLGDWFNSIALYALLLEYTGSGRAVGLALLCQLLPIFFFGPLAGIAADRLPRKMILIGTDLLRGLVVLGFLWADHPDRYQWCYLFLFIQVSLSAFFLPARQAALPSIASRRELLAANALSGITWSVMLAAGAGLGGLVSALLGRPTAFALDAVSYFVSAAILAPLVLPREPARKLVRSTWAWTGLPDLLDGLRYLSHRPGLSSVLLVKTLWGISGGVLLLYTVLGTKVFVLGRDAGLSIGLLYAARGLGAGAGPVLARALHGDRPSSMRRGIGGGFLLAALAYLALAFTRNVPLALLLVGIAHMGGSILWVFSTTLLHHRADPEFSGRVFAAEQAGVTLTMAASTWWVGHAVDANTASPQTLLAFLGALLLLPCALWTSLQRWRPGWYLGWDSDVDLDPGDPALQ